MYFFFALASIVNDDLYLSVSRYSCDAAIRVKFAIIKLKIDCREDAFHTLPLTVY